MPLPPTFPELAALDLFRSVVRLGSLSRAADAHHITQPSASSRIRTLERQLGVTVLDRSPTGSRPTPEGQLILGWADTILVAAEAMVTGVESLRARQAGLLRLAASYTIAEYLLPPWLDRFLADRPHDSVTLDVTNSHAVVERLESGSVDLGFIETPNAPPSMHRQIVGTDELIVVVSPRHTWATRDVVDLATFVATPLVLRETRIGHPGRTRGRAPPAGTSGTDVGTRPRVVVGGADRGHRRLRSHRHQPTRRRRRHRLRSAGGGDGRASRDPSQAACRVAPTRRPSADRHRPARAARRTMSETENSLPRTPSQEVLALPAVRLYLWSTALAAIGQNVMLTVLFKQVFDITGDELDIGFIGLAQFVPALLLVLVSGWVADRFDRRRVAGLFLGGRGACAVALVVFSVKGSTAVWQLFLIAFVLGSADAMVAPARRSIAPFIVPQRLFPPLIALWTATFTGSAIIGPILGGFIYSISPSWAYALAALLQFASVVPLVVLHYHRKPERITDRPTWASAVEGLHFVRRTPVVLATISLDLFAVLFGGAVALIPAVAEERLGVGDIGYGWLRAAPGIGAAAMALWIARRPLTRRIGPTLLTVVAIFGVGHVVFGLTRNYAVAFIALVILSAADLVSMNIRGAIVPLVTPDDQLGRVNAVEGVFIGASNELGAFESGTTARLFGLPWAIAGGGVITVGIAALFAVVFPSLRRIDTFDELRPPGTPDERDEIASLS